MALIELQSVSRFYRSGEETIAALKSLDLEIEAGEMVAIVGASGSGKSTLMNILGCLDRPSDGHYRVAGRDVAVLSHEDLATLRREHFGFIFQRYHLLAALDVAGNVEMPAIYAGISPVARRMRARDLLTTLGLGERLDHHPNQLSGGQQQRVAIARALVNGGEIILADEPTGALDSRSGEAVLRILKELNAHGHTIVIVTHDPAIAAHAPRVIELRDGLLIADTRQGIASQPAIFMKPIRLVPSGLLSVWRQRIPEAILMALRSMLAHRVRSALTMLGIGIGIAAVVAVVGLGEGSRRKVLSQISVLGASTISIYPGADWGDERASRIRTLTPDDAAALAAQPYIDSVTPETSTPVRLQIGNVSVNATVMGVGAAYFRVNTIELLRGRTLSERDVAERRNDVVIDQLTAARLIGAENPIGKVILVNKVPFIVTGVTAARNDGSGGRSLQAFMPHTSLAGRLLSPAQSLNGLTVRVADHYDTLTAEKAVVSFLTLRHGTKDFFTFNSDRVRKTIESTSHTMALLTSGVAMIALLVGGIGVMNMMLVSVTERTREIGLRMAVGARRLDIMLQFLIEAVAICLTGSVAGIGLALAAAFTAGASGGSLPMVIAPLSIVAACAAATATGLIFGFLPARNAARLNPVEALVQE